MAIATIQNRRTRMAASTNTGSSTEKTISQRSDQSTLSAALPTFMSVASASKVWMGVDRALVVRSHDPFTAADAGRGTMKIRTAARASAAQDGMYSRTSRAE